MKDIITRHIELLNKAELALYGKTLKENYTKYIPYKGEYWFDINFSQVHSINGFTDGFEQSMANNDPLFKENVNGLTEQEQTADEIIWYYHCFKYCTVAENPFEEMYNLLNTTNFSHNEIEQAIKDYLGK